MHATTIMAPVLALQDVEELEKMENSAIANRLRYDPFFCKTCQKRGSAYPEIARQLYSDCDMHYQKRIRQLRLAGVRII